MVARATALCQFLVRLPPPERYRNSAYLGTATQAAEELSGIYLGRDPSSSRVLGAGMSINLPAFIILRELSLVVIQAGKNMQSVPWSRVAPGQRVVAGPFIYPLDTARDTLLLAEKYLPIDYAENEEERKRKSEELQAFIKAVETQYREATNSYEREREKVRNRGLQMKLKDQVEAALQFNLVEEALRLLTDRETDLQKEFGREALRYALVRVGLRLITGRLEDAADDLDILPANFDEAEATPPKEFGQYVRQLRDPLRMQIYLKLNLEGNYAEAGTLLEQMQGNIVRSSGESESPSKLLPKLLPTAMNASATPWGVAIRLRELYRLQRNVIRNLQAGEGEFFFRRGILSLIEGDIAVLVSGSNRPPSRLSRIGTCPSSTSQRRNVCCA